MMKELSAWRQGGGERSLATYAPGVSPDVHLRQAEKEVHRLRRLIELKDRQICELRKALAHTATVHFSLEDRLQRELDTLRVMMPDDGPQMQCRPPGVDEPGRGTVVRLPYMTKTLSVLFDAMYAFWADCDDAKAPKSTTVAHAIDQRLGLSSQMNGEASRSGQAYASAIRPDWVKDADNRHHCRRAGGR